MVNPPQKPVMSNKDHSWDIPWCLVKYPKSNPIIKHPKRLAVNVPRGSVFRENFLDSSLMRYRRILPMPPPIPTSKICFMKRFELKVFKNSYFDWDCSHQKRLLRSSKGILIGSVIALYSDLHHLFF